MKLNDIPFKTAVTALGATWLLTACGLGGAYPGVPERLSANSIPVYRGPVAPPQVAYRIDENRYFEIVPREAAACSFGMIYYTDVKRKIHSPVLGTEALGGVDLIIDAANEDYLIGPISRGNTDCSSGGGGCGGANFPYSEDAGRTWKRASPRYTGSEKLYLAGDTVFYAGQKARLPEIIFGDSAWKEFPLVGANALPVLHRPPLDTKFHCTANGKE